MKKRIALFLTCLFTVVSLATAQVNSTSGVVTDGETGEPLIGATVKVQGTTVGVLTDADGKFTLKNLPAGAKKLEISYMGMVSQTANIKSTLNIVLQPDHKALDEVMVVAYGTATRASFTGSASVVGAEEIEGRLVSDVTNALSGTVAGVQALKSNGQPGTGSTIRVRGIGSMSASSSPLYVVDGMPYDGDISSINTQDIESMTVLKDAAASALYGARGANGVILITTKKGKRGQGAKITVEGRWGSNSREIKNYSVLKNTNQYYETAYQSLYNDYTLSQNKTANEAYLSANSKINSITGYKIYDLSNGQYLIGRNGKVNPNARLGYTDGEYYYTPDDWQKESFTNGLRQEYVATVSGANEKMDYYLSAGYLSDAGVIVGSGFDRITTRLNVNYQAKDWLKFGTNIAYTNTNSKYPDEQTNSGGSLNAFWMANNIAPVYPIYSRTPDGKIMKYGKNRIYDYGDGTTGNFTRNWMSMSNPIGDLTYRNEQYLMDVMNGKMFAEITPIEGLKVTGTWGLFVDNTRTHYASSAMFGQSQAYGGEAMQAHARLYGMNQQYLANYNHDFGSHNLDLLAGYESYSENEETSTAYGQGLYKPGDFTVNNTIDQKNGSGSVGSYATQGYLFRANYNFNEKYFGSVSYRCDGSSRFARGHKWGHFWSASAAWELKKENFLADATWINMLKVKASFGQQGNDGIGNAYAYVDQYQVTGSNGQFSDANLVYKANKNITWEKSNSFNTGVDFNFWRGRLSGSVEYFNRTTSDMLYNKPVSPSLGYSSIPMNIGSMRNQGLEVDLTAQLLETNHLSWDFNVNGTFLRNKVLKLHPDLKGELISGSYIYREGDPMYQLYLVEYAGVNKNNGLATYWAKNDSENTIITDAYGNDINPGEEYITEEYTDALSTNRKAQGNMMAPFYGGFGTSLTFYGFDLSVQCAYQLGGKVYDSGYQSLMHCGSSDDIGNNWHKDILNAWTPTNTNSDIPRIAANDYYTNANSTRFVTSSNYLSLNNITLGYTLPKKAVRKIKLESIRLYGAADNVALWSARKGLDPRTTFTAADNGSYSALRTVTFGVKATF